MAETKDATSGEITPPTETNNEPEIRKELRETVFDRILLWLCSVVFCLVLVFVIVQVLVRYVTVHIGFSLPWTEELARYLLVLIAFIGSAVAFRKQEHIAITSLIDHFPTKVRLVHSVVACLLIMFFISVVTIGSVKFTYKMMVMPTGAIPWLKAGHLYGIITIGMALIAVYQVRWLIKYATEIKRLFWGKGSGRS